MTLNSGNKTVAGLLAVVAGLLGLNVIVKGTPPARASQARAGAGEPVLVDGDYTNEAGAKVWRFFSDGTVDVTNFSWQGGCAPASSCDPGEEGPHVVLPPAKPPGSPGPTIVAGRRQDTHILRYWSDGSVDVTTVSFAGDTNWCVPVPTCGANSGPFQVIGPAPNPACAFFDSDVDGAIGVNDFLDLLANWGPCP